MSAIKSYRNGTIVEDSQIYFKNSSLL
uniref:Uncharacterized protein n=1 Tax=Anguilla anguilla TaxID=7936 RepID=A0A0E9XXF5_ANGAN